MAKRRIIVVASLVVAILALGAALAWRFVASKPLRVALVGFFDADALAFENAADELGIRLVPLSRDAFFDPKRFAPEDFDAAIVRTMGMKPEYATPETAARLAPLRAAILYPATNEKFAALAKLPEGIGSEQIGDYLATPTRRNALGFLALLKRALTGEPLDVPPPEELPVSGFFYLGGDVNATFDEWLRRPDVPKLPETAPRVALVGPFLNPFKTEDSKPLQAIVEAFARRGIRAVPIYGFRAKPEQLDEVAPELVVAFPLGRLLPDAAAPKRFGRRDVPVLTAINLSVSSAVWLAEPVGMTPTYQNLAVALPELDGATAPIPISTLEKDADGREPRAPIPERVERLADRAARWIALRRKPNAEKRIAILYRRAPGAAAITAQSLDAVPSLYNALLAMRERGYDLGDAFPATEEEFAAILDRRGRTIGQWAPGAFQQFLRDGTPERVATAEYQRWREKDLSARLRAESDKLWGAAPGVCFSGTTEDGASFVAVSRVAFGNVVLMPQPTTEILDDDPIASDFRSVHGTNKAPPHFYQAAYLWAREGFRADAILHFGTHGSLEFARGKSLMLSEDDWPDALIGDVPSVYLYSVNNVGEALLAKRRIAATLVSHTTPPFMNPPPTDKNAALAAALDAFDATQDRTVREELDREIERLASESGLTPFDEETETHDEHEELAERRAEFYREQLDRLRETSVTDGLHTLGRPWTEEQLRATAAAIASDAVGADDALARLRESTSGLETTRLLDALEGRFIPPSTGGDPIVNPESLPTGRNMAGTNIEQTPDAATFRVAQRLTEETIEAFRAKNGRYPRRIAYTLWGGEYIRTRGLTLAQALWTLGVRPVYDKRGTLRELEVVPSEELGRPRIDVLAQTSGQFRDAAPSRIEALDRAVRMVAALDDEPFPNYVRENSERTAEALRASGFVAQEATELSTARIFGAPNALNYGTGIRKLVERSDKWETRATIADQYLLNMGGIYRNAKVWGVPIEGLLELNLEGTDLMAQSRSSNVWGPVKLDHLYEFGTLGAVVKEKTGADPEFLLSDARRSSAIRTQSLKEAIRDEMQTTFWNRRWLEGLTREPGGGGAETLAKATRNLFGWSAVGAKGLIDDATWRRTVETFVDDRLNLGLREYFEKTNPAALAETAAIALDAARKEFWAPTDAELRALASVLADSVARHGASCSYDVCGNAALREYVAANLSDDDARGFRDAIDAAIRDPGTKAEVAGVELVETKREKTDESADAAPRDPANRDSAARLLVAIVAAAIVALGFASPQRTRREV